jgi:glycosyltransferase involved in cell wall biosynthesis
MEQQQISVVIPTYNAATTLPRCLDALIAQADLNLEIIVVDDGSVDSTRQVAARDQVRLIAMPEHSGDAQARNAGARAARGDVLFFLDADVALLPRMLARARTIIADPDFAAAIGSYDDDPYEHSTVSRFKNLAHHYFHQRSGGDATTFWTACGLIRRELFISSGGFSERARPGIRDVELGYLLTAAGTRIKLDPGLQVKHLKAWTLRSLLAADLKLRAIPWAALLLKYRSFPAGLNFSSDQKCAAVTAFMLAGALGASLVWPGALVIVAILVIAAVLMNRGLYRLFWDRGGLRLLFGGFLLQQFYYFYSVVGLIAGIVLCLLGRSPLSTR